MTVEQQKQMASEYKHIFLDEYGIQLSDQEAEQQAISMLQLFNVLTDRKKSD